MSRPEALITLPSTGLRVFPPEETRRNILLARTINNRLLLKQQIKWSDEEKARLKLLSSNSIYKKRFPTPTAGQNMMEQVDYGRGETFRSYADELSDLIVLSWQQINDTSEIAVVLFGSIATGLVKKEDHPEPSNIDLAVIGDFTDVERNKLYDATREKRREIQERILMNCKAVSPLETNPGNAGVFIQHDQRLRSNNYQCALEYISSNAVALHDPGGIWSEIEQEALAVYEERTRMKQSRNRKGAHAYPSKHDFYQRNSRI